MELAPIVATLRRHYGRPPRPVSRDPFALILWEQVAYLVPDAQRRRAFAALREGVGLSPSSIVAAPTSQLRTIARLGGPIAAPVRATRMQRSAEMVVTQWDGNLRRALTLPIADARRALAKFPMIGEPGADKVLAFASGARVLPLDSNALRVVVRLGLVQETRDYRSTYRQAQSVLNATLPASPGWPVDAFHLLRLHGQELCRRNAPDCPACPLKGVCAIGGRDADRVPELEPAHHPGRRLLCEGQPKEGPMSPRPRT